MGPTTLSLCASGTAISARRREHSSPPEVKDIADGLGATLQILPHQLARRLAEQNVNPLKCLVLCLRHEEDLVEPADHSDTTVEAEGQTDPRHGRFHVAEEVGHQPGTEEQCDVGRLHAVATEISWVDLGRQGPCQTGVRTEESLVEDKARDVAALCTPGVGVGVDQIAATDDEQADKETGQRGASPETAAEALHEKDCGDGPKKEGAPADKRHEDRLLGVEADLAHEGRHVVHDGVDAGKLTEEDHDVGIDNRTTGSGDCDEV